MTTLTNLNIGANKLRSLPPGIFDGLGSLSYVNLQENPWESLPPNLFSGMCGLTSIDVGDVSPAAIAGGVFGGKTLCRGLGVASDEVKEVCWEQADDDAEAFCAGGAR
ncbi:hypothetical protein TeGR_g14072 [Tetraparma gracilis]|uniref:Uncharacterized protein n=1 Tax=Tetraparma gracilis TaxID=2962635 RepID=A0ABQ6M695_9STRA|nr:hypothetical protein TeGR_g14072 [Tetraparma gracilis]